MKIRFRRIWEKSADRMLPSAVTSAPIPIERAGVFRIEYGDDSLGFDVFINLEGKIELFLPKKTRERVLQPRS